MTVNEVQYHIEEFIPKSEENKVYLARLLHNHAHGHLITANANAH